MMAGVAYKSMATSMWKGQKIAAAIVNMEIEEGKDMEGFSPRCYRKRRVEAMVTMERISSDNSMDGGMKGR